MYILGVLNLMTHKITTRFSSVKPLNPSVLYMFSYDVLSSQACFKQESIYYKSAIYHYYLSQSSWDTRMYVGIFVSLHNTNAIPNVAQI
jgi:hypothetical protein